LLFELCFLERYSNPKAASADENQKQQNGDEEAKHIKRVELK
jgi:hypothetical protein